MLVLSGLRKTYPGGIRALDGVDLEIGSGMFGLLGPNGSGKTTVMKILSTLLEPDGGEVRMNGVDLLADRMKTRRMLGYLPQDFGLYPSFTAEQMLDYLAKLKGLTSGRERRAQTAELFERVNLAADRKRRLGTFSGGMRQRFGIAQALLGRPQLLIVDEPTAGLDPEERIRFHNLLVEMATEVVVILSTHLVSDVSALCSRLAIIRRGRILAACAPSEAIRHLTGTVWEAFVDGETMRRLRSQLTVISSQIFAGQYRLRVLAEQSPGAQFTSVAPTLEDYYLSLINGAAAGEAA